MKVGDLVKARYWGTGYIGIVVSIRNQYICSVMINGGDTLCQLIKDLEIINKKT